MDTEQKARAELVKQEKVRCSLQEPETIYQARLNNYKIHRILSFTQRAWLKPWIDMCNEQRKAARSEFESDLAKLHANATFGKNMEQVRNRVNVRLIADPNKLLKAVAKVSFRESEIINQDLVMVRGLGPRSL